ncbi:TB2/DP1/HVA22-related protein [Sesbania bispinosa]|nr:TB2/DP1/HVA22-related protein [Sesbania bispinosa]
MSLIQWFQFWPYIKLMIIFWLIIPDFGRASYVYNNLIRPCISINWRKFFEEKENILLHADYRKENATEALEKLIASKDTTYKPEAEATNAVRATYKEMLQTNGKRLQTERKDIKDLEVIEKKEIPAVKQVIPVMPNLATSHNVSTSTPMVETRGMAGKDRSGGELPQSSILHTRKCRKSGLVLYVREASIALKAKTKAASQKLKINQSKEELKQKDINNQLNSKTKNGGENIVNKG